MSLIRIQQGTPLLWSFSSVVERWIVYPDVRGSIPLETAIFLQRHCTLDSKGCTCPILLQSCSSTVEHVAFNHAVSVRF